MNFLTLLVTIALVEINLAYPEPKSSFPIDTIDKSPRFVRSLRRRQPNPDDATDYFSGSLLPDSSNMFSDSYSPGDLSILPDGDDEFGLTADATLQSACTPNQEQSLLDDGQGLLVARGAACASPASPPPQNPPLNPQLFQDPLGELQKATTPVEDPEWRTFQGHLYGDNKADKYPCGPYVSAGYIWPLCCSQEVSLKGHPHEVLVYPSLSGCLPSAGMLALEKKNPIFFLKNNTRPEKITANRFLYIGSYVSCPIDDSDVCCKSYVSHSF